LVCVSFCKSFTSKLLKTNALLEYLNSNQVPKDAHVVCVSFCNSFTSKLLKNIGGGFVIVQYESLMRLNIHHLGKTILILDESESILTQLELVQLNDYDNIYARWVVFDNLVKHLAKVISMDADTGFCTYDLLASSCKKVHMINNLWHPSPEEAPIDMYYDKSETFFAAVVAAANQAKTEPFIMVSTLRT